MEEVILSQHRTALWWRRENERTLWVEEPKRRRYPKRLKRLGSDVVDFELYPSLFVLNQYGITTEYSCSGVSVLDEPEDHSLYAYVTLPKTKLSTDFIHYLRRRMAHRILIIEELGRQRYDISSFFIQHNRSFCLFLYYCTLDFVQFNRGFAS
jgi:hypothetical protein